MTFKQRDSNNPTSFHTSHSLSVLPRCPFMFPPKPISDYRDRFYHCTITTLLEISWLKLCYETMIVLWAGGVWGQSDNGALSDFRKFYSWCRRQYMRLDNGSRGVYLRLSCDQNRTLGIFSSAAKQWIMPFSRSGKLFTKLQLFPFMEPCSWEDIVNSCKVNLPSSFAVAHQCAPNNSYFAYQQLLEPNLPHSERLVEGTVHPRACT